MIHEIPSVQFAAVVRFPDKVSGKITCVCIVPKRGEKVGPGEIVKYLKTNLADYKVPDRMEIFPGLLMTTRNKMQKYNKEDDLIAKYGFRGRRG